MNFSTSKPKIIVIGSCSVDLVLNVPNFPAQNETIMATKVESFFGGKGSNQAVACARLGANVFCIGAVGMDPFGQQILRNMKNEGVHVGFVYETIDSATGTAYVTSLGNKNTIVVVPAANSTISKKQLDDFEKFIPGSDFILLQLEIPLKIVEYATQLAKKHGVKVGIYAAPAQVLSSEILEYATFIVAKSTELEVIFGHSTKEEILHQYPNKLFVRDDSNSTTYYNGTEMKYYREDSSETSYTMGMGDAFTSGFAIAMCHKNSIDDCVQFGNLVSLKNSKDCSSQKALPYLADFK